MKQITAKSLSCFVAPIEIHKKKHLRIKKFSRKSVLKMLAVMEASQNAAGSSKTKVPAVTPEEAAANEKDFLSSGRTGRRNALPDILDPNSASGQDGPSKKENRIKIQENKDKTQEIEKTPLAPKSTDPKKENKPELRIMLKSVKKP